MRPPTGSRAGCTEPGAGAYQAVRDTDLTTKRGQEGYLVDRLGLTRNEARRLIAAYQRDVADARRIGNSTRRSDADFIDWLMRQSPAQRPRSIRKYQIGETGWRTR